MPEYDKSNKKTDKLSKRAKKRVYLKTLIGLFILLFFLSNRGVSLALLEFYIFKDYYSEINHFLSVAKNGDFRNIICEMQTQLNSPKDGDYIRITYSPKDYDKHSWSSISWIVSNEEKENSYNLAGAKRLVFFAKGHKGGEIVQFDLGSISLEGANLNGGSTGAIVLSKEWREYSIDLEGLDLSSMTVGFSFTMNKFDNSKGAIFYLDEIKYEFWDL